MKLVDTPGGPVAVHRTGEGPAVVLLHANPGDSRDYAAVLPALAAELTVYAVDWPGYGDSPPPQPPSSATAMGYADLVPQLVAGLGIERAAFIGNSVGGYAAASYALREPSRVSALVLVNSGGFVPLTPLTRAFIAAKGTERVTALLAGRFPRLYLRARNPFVHEILAREQARRDRARRGDRACIAVEAASWRSFADPRHDLRARTAGLTTPTLLVWGVRDPLLGRAGRHARRAIPHARWHPLPTGHAPYAEAPEDFLAATLPFLRAHAVADQRRT